MKNYLPLLLIPASTFSIASSCTNWDKPGADKNTSPPEVSVRHYRPDLESRVRERTYDEIATVRNGIWVGDSGTKYANMRDMHSGNNKWCQGIVTLGLAAEGQIGFIYCTNDDRCIVVPFICNNVSQVDRLRDRSYGLPALVPLPLPAPAPADLPTAGPIGYSEGLPYTFNGNPAGGGDYGYGGGPGFGPGGSPGSYIGGNSYYSCSCCETPTPPIPEPSTYLLLCAGLITIFLRKCRPLS